MFCLPPVKDYVDRGVQTIPQPHSPPPLAPKTSSAALERDSLLRATGFNMPVLSNRDYPDDACNRSFLFKSPSPVRTSVAAHRMHKTRQLPYNRPRGSPKNSSRVVSLPEIESFHATKALLDATTSRLVSNPERPKPTDLSALSPCFFNFTSAAVAYVPGDEVSTRVRVGPPSAIDMPYTPSPPSSPDSVLIVEDSGHLSRSFLGSGRMKDTQAFASEDEGNDLPFN